ncbi:MAG: hypothetical protein EVA86_02115 [Rhodobacteraceae bacterium]|nr:MAG: hypothetical protein EVA86_02115 [Paracoccaceae bacterium]
MFPDDDWRGECIGAQQIKLIERCIDAGRHIRTGRERTVRLDKHTLAPSMLRW